jgi:glycerol kinase
MLLNTGDKPVISKHGLLTTIGWQIKDKVSYALEGSVFIGGAVVQWLRDEMDMLENSAQSEEFAKKVKDSNGIYIVPAFVGLGTPYWDNDVRGSVFGLTRGANKYHFARAALESIAYQCKDVIEVMIEESKLKIKKLKVDGGATSNKYLMQFQADILGSDIILPTCLETTALGVSYLAGLESGYFPSLSAIEDLVSHKKIYKNLMSSEEAKKHYDGWKRAIEASRVFKI